MIILFIFLLIVFNVIRYYELKEYTTLQNFEQYWRFDGKISIAYNLMFITIFTICMIIKYLF